MFAIIRTSEGPALGNLPPPTLVHPGDVRIQVVRAAICRTDLFAARGEIPVEDGRILGHEFTGRVLEMGAAVSHLALGDRVVVDPLLPCGSCPDCRSGSTHDCAEAGFLGLQRQGAFAEQIVVAGSQVHVLPREVDFTTGAYAEPLAASLAVLRAPLLLSEPIAVTGRGRIAELTRFVLENSGYTVVNTTEMNGTSAVVIETDLTSANVEQTLRLVSPGGLLVLKSRLPQPLALPPLLAIRKRLRIECVNYAPFTQAMGFLNKHAAAMQTWVGSEWRLEQFSQAFTEAERDEAKKIFFTISDT